MRDNITANMIGFYKKIFDTSEDFLSVLFKYGIYDNGYERDKFVYDLIDILMGDDLFKVYFQSNLSSKEIYNKEYEKTVEDYKYYSLSPFYKIQKSLKNHLGFDFPWQNPFYKDFFVQILFVFSYGNIKNFFYLNRKKFLPEYDWFLIENEERKKIHIESFFKEFDKFSSIIDFMADLNNIDEVGEDKISYLSAVLGIKFDTEEDDTGYINSDNGYFNIELFSVSKIRNLLKKIIEIYKSKGSKFAYELFFNSIGIDIELKETYFDRRLFWESVNDYADENYNIETDENRNSNFYYYITSKNPSNYFYDIAPDEIVSLEDMTSTKTESSFNFFISSIGEDDTSIKKILGYESSEIAETFTYFKTNILLLDFKYYLAGSEEESIISQKHRDLLKSYIDMITPIYIKKYYPESQSAESTFLERTTLVFLSGDGYSGFYKNGKYIEVERSYIKQSNKWYDLEGNPSSFQEGFSALTEDNSISLDCAEKNKNDIWENTFNKIREDNNELYYFYYPEDNILNNIEFEWAPNITGKQLSVENGYIEIEYYNSLNTIVAVSIQNGTETEVALTISDI
jgi:hypothetical protein